MCVYDTRDINLLICLPHCPNLLRLRLGQVGSWCKMRGTARNGRHTRLRKRGNHQWLSFLFVLCAVHFALSLSFCPNLALAFEPLRVVRLHEKQMRVRKLIGSYRGIACINFACRGTQLQARRAKLLLQAVFRATTLQETHFCVRRNIFLCRYLKT